MDPECTSTPNFIKIVQCAPTILQFKHFKMADIHHLEFYRKIVTNHPRLWYSIFYLSTKFGADVSICSWYYLKTKFKMMAT